MCENNLFSASITIHFNFNSIEILWCVIIMAYFILPNQKFPIVYTITYRPCNKRSKITQRSQLSHAIIACLKVAHSRQFLQFITMKNKIPGK